jgi:hypothetical protein
MRELVEGVETSGPVVLLAAAQNEQVISKVTRGKPRCPILQHVILREHGLVVFDGAKDRDYVGRAVVLSYVSQRCHWHVTRSRDVKECGVIRLVRRPNRSEVMVAGQFQLDPSFVLMKLVTEILGLGKHRVGCESV